MDQYVIKHGQALKKGFTTGSCAAAAAKAAAMMLENGKVPDFVELHTPAQVVLTLGIVDAQFDEKTASCAVIKEAGDDPDVTDKIRIYAQVQKRNDGQVIIEGGAGIGRITRAGFIGEVGEAAINPVPRQMITEAVSQIAEHGWDVLIYCPTGETVAQKTFNSKLGIEGGISILGTTGIVDPMSDEAWKQSIYLEIDAIVFAQSEELILYLGNYGRKIIDQLHLDAPRVKISNFIGETLLYCNTKAFDRITLIGHIGKLCKLAIGSFNTHSKVCDSRIESFVYYLALADAPSALIHDINQCKTAEEAVQQIMEEGYESIFDAMTQGCVQRIQSYLKYPKLEIRIILFSINHGLLGKITT